jgi:co-chaperonin GroES (HSP10)
MKIKAIGKHIIIAKTKKENKKGSLFLIKDDNVNFEATLIDAGEKSEAKELIGKKVLVRAYAGNKLEEDENTIYFLISFEDMLGVYNDS